RLFLKRCCGGRKTAAGPRPPASLLLLRDRVQHVLAHERAERLRHHHGTVLLLVVLQDRDNPPRGGQRAVERGHEPRLAVSVAVADVETAGLELGAVRRGRELAVAALAGKPRLAVVLACRARPQVT